MKNLLLLAAAFAGSLSYGSYLVCSAPGFYYSSVRHDFGAPPPPGIESGKLTIAKDGKTLVNKKFFTGENSPTPRYAVVFEGPKEILHESGVPVAGRAVYGEVAVLKTLRPLPEKEILRTPVVCDETWAFVP